MSGGEEGGSPKHPEVGKSRGHSASNGISSLDLVCGQIASSIGHNVGDEVSSHGNNFVYKLLELLLDQRIVINEAFR